ncbi:hypothetical protein ALC57_18979, partial [Trachymyrmex cornetzi]
YCLLPFADTCNVTYVNRRLMTLTKIIRYLSDNYCHVDGLDRDKCYVFTDMLIIELHKVLHDHFQLSGIVYCKSCQFRTWDRLLRFFLTSCGKIKIAIFGKIPVLLDGKCLYVLLRA